MKKLCLLILSGLSLTIAAAAPAQERVLIGISRNGGTVFQTIVHRGRNKLHSEMEADGPNSRTESHARLDDGDSPAEPAPEPVPARAPQLNRNLEQQPRLQSPPAMKPAPQTQPVVQQSDSPKENESRHMICILQSNGGWKAVCLTPDQDKAQHAVQVLRQQQIEARVFQFMPLPAEAAGLLPIDNAVGVAVRLTGEIYAVATDGRLIEIIQPNTATTTNE